MTHDILLALWFFLPAGVANAAPVLAAHAPLLARLNAPLDLGLTFRGKPLLGTNKTWRGLLSGVVLSTLTLWLQQLLAGRTGGVIQGIEYTQLPVLLLGPLLALGALGGDAVESFFKRRRGTAPGQSWFPFDQLDYIAGACIAASAVLTLPIGVYAWSLLLWPAVHLIASYTGYLLGMKQQPI